jgi:hypothetical protein
MKYFKQCFPFRKTPWKLSNPSSWTWNRATQWLLSSWLCNEGGTFISATTLPTSALSCGVMWSWQTYNEFECHYYLLFRRHHRTHHSLSKHSAISLHINTQCAYFCMLSNETKRRNRWNNHQFPSAPCGKQKLEFQQMKSLETDWQAFQEDVTEQFGLLGNAPDLYSEGPRFESLLRHRLSWHDFRGFCHSFQTNAWMEPQSGHDRFPRNCFQFIYHSTIRPW